MFNLAAVRSAVPLRERRPWPPLFNSFINDALFQLSPDTGKALLQVIDVPYRCLVDAFLYQPPYPVVDWINVKQEKVMFNLAAVRSAVPLRERRLPALAATVQ